MNAEPLIDAPRPLRSDPPPLPESASRLEPARVAVADAQADQMMARLAASDYAGALMAAEALLELRPRDPDANACAQMARSELRALCEARLGGLDRVPYVVMGPAGLFALEGLDFRAGYLVSRIDGLASVREIVSAGSVPSLDALRILSELHLRRVIAFVE